jgi:hypothetical protein
VYNFLVGVLITEDCFRDLGEVLDAVLKLILVK